MGGGHWGGGEVVAGRRSEGGAGLCGDSLVGDWGGERGGGRGGRRGESERKVEGMRGDGGGWGGGGGEA